MPEACKEFPLFMGFFWAQLPCMPEACKKSPLFKGFFWGQIPCMPEACKGFRLFLGRGEWGAESGGAQRAESRARRARRARGAGGKKRGRTFWVRPRRNGIRALMSEDRTSGIARSPAIVHRFTDRRSSARRQPHSAIPSTPKSSSDVLQPVDNLAQRLHRHRIHRQTFFSSLTISLSDSLASPKSIWVWSR